MSTELKRLYDFTDDRDNGIKIQAARMDGEFDNIVSSINKKVQIKATAPASPSDGDTWVDTGQDPVVVKMYDSTNSRWIQTDGYVDRGDPAAVDIDKTDLTTDETWNDLDLSSIVGAGAKIVHLLIQLQDDAAGAVLMLRKNGYSDSANSSRISTQVANVYTIADAYVPLDSSGVIEYYGSNTTFSNINITVKGWWY